MSRTWAELQAAFAASIADSSLPPPSGVLECAASNRRGGFAVYRNNSMAALIEALQERFPVARRLVGDEFFRAMAGAFASRHRPASPLLMHYGDEFPAFIDDFAPAADVAYLADVARLELAWSEAHHAAEARSLDPQAVLVIPLGDLLATRLTLHSSTRILRSVHPVADIWMAHQIGGELAPPARWEAQSILVLRPDAQVQVHTLAPGMYEFVAALLARRSVQDAAGIALACDSGFDAGCSVMALFDLGAVVALDTCAGEKQT